MRFRIFVAVCVLALVPVVVGAQDPVTPKTRIIKPTVYTPGEASGVTWPSVMKEVKPTYPEQLKEKINGAAELELVVGEDGKVSEAKITKSIDSGGPFDQAALLAAKQWMFKPGLKEGKPVATKVGLVLEFRKK